MRRLFVFVTDTGKRRRGLGPREHAGMSERGQAEKSPDGDFSSA